MNGRSGPSRTWSPPCPLSEIRSSNLEILNKSEYRMTKTKSVFRELWYSNFDIVSNFGFRASSLECHAVRTNDGGRKKGGAKKVPAREIP
jgi:hypothetical protein